MRGVPRLPRSPMRPCLTGRRASSGRVGSVPGEPAGFEAFTGGWGEVVFGPGQGWGQGPVVGWADVVSPVVGEAQPVGGFGVAFDGVGALVVEAVVVGAQGAEVAGGGEAAVFAVDEVVDVDPAGLVAAGVASAFVAVFDDEP